MMLVGRLVAYGGHQSFVFDAVLAADIPRLIVKVQRRFPEHIAVQLVACDVWARMPSAALRARPLLASLAPPAPCDRLTALGWV